MTRSELIEVLCSKYVHLSYKNIEDIVKQIFDDMTDALLTKGRIEIRGFGSFSLRKRMARLARNPKTGEKLQTKSKFSLHFKPGKELRERVITAREQGITIVEE